MPEILIGDCLEILPTLDAKTFDCCVTSPPYFNLRDYGHEKQIGREKSGNEYISVLTQVFSEVHRLLKDDGTLWINLGDKYAKDGQRMMLPARLAISLQANGWILRDEIVWHKTTCIPYPSKNRCTPNHEMIYMFSKQKSYYFDYLAIEVPSKKPGQVRKRPPSKKYEGTELLADNLNLKDVIQRETSRKRSVWSCAPAHTTSNHLAQFPENLIRPCIRAGCRPGGVLLDPFGGAGTTGVVALQERRECILIELSPDYAAIARERLDSLLIEKI